MYMYPAHIVIEGWADQFETPEAHVCLVCARCDSSSSGRLDIRAMSVTAGPEPELSSPKLPTISTLDFAFRLLDRVIVQGKPGYGTGLAITLVSPPPSLLPPVPDLSFLWSGAVVRWVGKVEGSSGTWFGVELDTPGAGNSDGMYMNQRFFTCPANSALFVRVEALYHAPESQQMDARMLGGIRRSTTGMSCPHSPSL
jgi:hypothetical protein